MFDVNGEGFLESLGDAIRRALKEKSKRPKTPASVAIDVMLPEPDDYYVTPYWRLKKSEDKITIENGKVCGCTRVCTWIMTNGGFLTDLPAPHADNPGTERTGKKSCDSLCPSQPWF